MKSIITIEKEYFDNEEGELCVKRVVKEGESILYEGITTQERIETVDTQLNFFDRWIENRKNPKEIKQNSSDNLKEGDFLYIKGKD